VDIQHRAGGLFTLLSRFEDGGPLLGKFGHHLPNLGLGGALFRRSGGLGLLGGCIGPGLCNVVVDGVLN
jgi:hypothetical protein